MSEPQKCASRFTLVLIPAIFCLIAGPSARSSEPVYNGKPLSEWLLELKLKNTAHHWEQIQAQTQQPEDAIRQIGTNAIPVLLNILGATEQNKWWVLEKLKSREFRRMFRDRDTNLNDLQDVAVNGFGILGTNAASAIPQINKLFRDWQTCSPAAQALAQLGPEGIAALTNGLSSKNDDIRGVTIWVIGEKAPMDSNTIAKLMIAGLKDPDPINRGTAAMHLGGKDPALAIPALIPILDDKEFYPVVHAARALGSYGALAKVAAPKLLSLFTNHVVVQDRQSANNWVVELMWALPGMDRDTAAEAEAFLVKNGPLGASFGYTTTLLPNGKELITGGSLQTKIPTTKNYIFSEAKLFDPVAGKWTETDSMNVARYGHTATLLHNGKVLVAGGEDAKGNYLSSAELYDPTTEKWTETGSMSAASAGAEAVLQSNGKVRIPGHYEGDQKRPGDNLYDPATGTWTVITNK